MRVKAKDCASRKVRNTDKSNCGFDGPASKEGGGGPLTKILPALIVALMGLHILKPFGWPGLRRRGDFWKIAVAAILAMMLAGALHLYGI